MGMGGSGVAKVRVVETANKPSERSLSLDPDKVPVGVTPKAEPRPPIDWFHRLQMEGIGILGRPEAGKESGGGFHKV